MFFTLEQNKNKGFYVTDKTRKLAQYLIVEGPNIDHIKAKLEKIILFGEKGANDCSCSDCKPRWIWPENPVLDEVPSLNGKPLDIPSGISLHPVNSGFKCIILLQKGTIYLLNMVLKS